MTVFMWNHADNLFRNSIHVEDGEYVDMGKPMMNGMVIPVVVKTLIFG